MQLPLSRRGLIQQAFALPLLAAPKAAPPVSGNVPVSLLRGENRRKNVYEALVALDDQIKPKLARKRSVVIKPNLVSTNKQLAATHADALHGILDYLAPRWKGPTYIAESSAGDTLNGYENFGYDKVIAEHKDRKVSLVDLNDEALYEVLHILNSDLHPQPVRLAARLLDPDAFVICSAMLKTHNTVVATLSVKNMTLGAPLHQSRKETKRWNDKRVYHGGVRQTHYDMMLTAQRMKSNWGFTVLDGFEGMEGNGPSSGTPVPQKVVVASTDFVAADRIGVEVMGINPEWVGYLKFCGQSGVGCYDRDKIELRGEKMETVAVKYQLHADIERELQWMGPMTELPPKLG